MQIAGVYSFNHGKEAIVQHHRQELEEVLQVIESIDVEQYRTKARRAKMMKDRVLYDPYGLNKALQAQFLAKRWLNHKVFADYSTNYYVPGYSPLIEKSDESAPYRNLDFVKNKLGAEAQFDSTSSMICSICAKMTIFAKMGVIDCGIEIVPVKGLVDGMSTGVSYFEQFVWDLEYRGVSDIDIPVLILGIDTDGVRPGDLKIAERRQPYLF